MDQVFYLASRRIEQNIKDQAKLETQFYDDHAWQRVRGLNNAIIRVYCSLTSFAGRNSRSGFLSPKCSNEF